MEGDVGELLDGVHGNLAEQQEKLASGDGSQ